MLSFQGQVEWQDCEAAYKRMLEIEAVINAGNATWLTFRDHASAKNCYADALQRYLKAA